MVSNVKKKKMFLFFPHTMQETCKTTKKKLYQQSLQEYNSSFSLNLVKEWKSLISCYPWTYSPKDGRLPAPLTSLEVGWKTSQTSLLKKKYICPRLDILGNFWQHDVEKRQIWASPRWNRTPPLDAEISLVNNFFLTKNKRLLCKIDTPPSFSSELRFFCDIRYLSKMTKKVIFFNNLDTFFMEKTVVRFWNSYVKVSFFLCFFKSDAYAKNEFYNILSFFVHFCPKSCATALNEIHENVEKNCFFPQNVIYK